MDNKNGFTLLELMVGIAIIAILTAVAVPNYEAWLSGHRLSSSARDIYSMFQLARLRAVKENSDVIVNIDTGSGQYVVFVDDNDNGFQDGTEPTIKSVVLEKGVTVDDVTVSQINFNGRGFPTPLGTTVTIKNIKGIQKQIILSQVGHVRID